MRSPVSNDVAPPLRDGRYRLVAMVGSGATAAVYRAFDTRLSVYRAIKLLHDKYQRELSTRERFEEEASVMAGLRHANIVTVYDIDVDRGRPFIVMEYAPGGSLMQRVDRLGQLDPTACAHVLIEVLDGLYAAHSNGVIHRDIKPHNILFGEDESPLLTDFGVALRVDERWTPRSRPRILGTPTYMSPEQRANPQAAGPRSDIYSMGLTLYVLLTGRQPYAPHEVAEAYKEMASVHPELAAIALKASSTSPDDRYNNALDMADALCKVAVSLPEFTSRALHTPGTAPLRFVAPPSIPPMADTWPIAPDDTAETTYPPPYLAEPYAEPESLHPNAGEHAAPITVRTRADAFAIAALVVLFVGASALTWVVLNRAGPALAAMTP